MPFVFVRLVVALTNQFALYVQIQQPRIIRFGENEEDVFLLKKDDTRRVALVERLKRDPTSPERWLELLKSPTSYEAKLYSKVRLYRRAITLMQKEDCRHNKSYVEIWILFAKLKGYVISEWLSLLIWEWRLTVWLC